MQIEDVPTVYNLRTDRFKERFQFGIVHQIEGIKFTVFQFHIPKYLSTTHFL